MPREVEAYRPPAKEAVAVVAPGYKTPVKTRKPATCGSCGASGHTRRSNSCPNKVRTTDSKKKPSPASGKKKPSPASGKKKRVIHCSRCKAEGHNKSSRKCPKYPK